MHEQAVYIGVVLSIFAVAGIDLACAFIMRGERESGRVDTNRD